MKIRLTSLKDGLNELDFEHTSDSLALTEVEEWGDSFKSAISVKIQVNKVGVRYFFHTFIDTVARLTCDRCLKGFNQRLSDEFRLVFSSTEENWSDIYEEEEFRLILPGTTEIDITNDIREALLLAIPMKILCSQDCRGLCPHCGVNLNFETCDCQSKQIDPRWEALKKLHNPIGK